MESAEISMWGGANSQWGDESHLQFKYCLGRHFQRKPGAATYAATPLPGTVSYYGKYGPSYYVTSIKRLDEGLREQILGQKLSISPELYI